MAVTLLEAARLTNASVYVGRPGSSFPQIMKRSRLQLNPRGYGRTSYHLAETIQLGLLPVHIFSDVPWLPYPELLRDVVYTAPIGRAAELFRRLLTEVSLDELIVREQRLQQILKRFQGQRWIWEHSFDNTAHWYVDLEVGGCSL